MTMSLSRARLSTSYYLHRFLFPVRAERKADERGARRAARATVLNGIIAIKVVAFPRGRRVYAPRHPTDAELMILINVS